MNHTRLVEWERQRIYERYDGLDDACSNLKWAMEALKGMGHEDAISVLEDMRQALGRERDIAHRQLERLDEGDQAALEREFKRCAL